MSLLAMLGSCLVNDLPYPRIQVNFTSMQADGLMSAAQIDSVNRQVTLAFDEATDLSAVKITNYSINPPDAYMIDSFPETLDLTRPYVAVLHLYQDYSWTIIGTQKIDRYFQVATQIGSSVIDVPGRRVVAYVPKGTDLSKLRVERIKLAGVTSVMKPAVEGAVVDFSRPVEIEVTEFGRKSIWTIYIEVTDLSVEISELSPWTRVAWITANAEAGKNNGFVYRMVGDKQWNNVPSDWISETGGQITARLVHLSPSTVYEVRAYSDTDSTAVQTFTTGTEAQMPNSSLDEWWLNGKVWNPWPEGGVSFWDTGNKGATTLGQSNSEPTEDTSTGQGYAAMLQSKFIGIGSIGKLAAGNIFTGEYVRTDGTNGILAFGRPFTERPTRLRGWLKYKCVPISHVGTGFSKDEWLGRPDTANIYIALADWAQPYEIRTNPNNRQLFDPAMESVIAYGSIQYGETVAEYIPFEITLDYKSTSRRPTYILCVASASKYGDFFVGGSGSVLYLDDLQLDYDY